MRERFSVGSLPLKGGGQEGVGAASSRFPGYHSQAVPLYSSDLTRERPALVPSRRILFPGHRRCHDPLLSSPFQGEGPDRRTARSGCHVTESVVHSWVRPTRKKAAASGNAPTVVDVIGIPESDV